ncbi:MAG: 2-C-methyl-D-erythritol 4-phosphate cytidylyltransferase [Propionibacteriaceae bacterium]|nr:2-C-methyl-D-erythritol 4-phosphate cytidylyltransferase [Propionibacteriaceae bacterium]
MAIIFAGGAGKRLRHDELPKQFRTAGGKPVIIHTLEHFQEHPAIDAIYVSCLEGWQEQLVGLVEDYEIDKVCDITHAGVTAMESIFYALRAAARDWEPESLAFIHDAVRPVLEPGQLSRLLVMARERGNAVSCSRATETCLVSRDGELAELIPDRNHIFMAQAPQVFALGHLLNAHEELHAVNPSYAGVVDCATLMKNRGDEIHLCVGGYGNLKLTYPQDLAYFPGLLESRE